MGAATVWKGIACLVLALMLAPMGFARDLHVAPGGARVSPAPDGSAAAPWPSVTAALDVGGAQGGDRILLMDGSHGPLKLERRMFDRPLVIEAKNRGRAHVTAISVGQARNIVIRGLSVWPLAPSQKGRDLVSVSGEGIRLERLDIRGRRDAAETYPHWKAGDWLVDWRANGVRMAGTGNALTDSRIIATAFGVTVSASRTEVRDNLVAGFSGDGLRGLADDLTFSGNRVQDCIRVDGNHMDGFQSWSSRKDRDRPLKNLTLDGNSFLEWANLVISPYRCGLQGISLFDGPFENVRITNNLVVTSTYHGIAMVEARDSAILNNTVVQPAGRPGNHPWIMVETRKGRGGHVPDEQVTVANNVSNSYKGIAEPLRRNVVVKAPDRMFVNPADGDFRPRPGGPLIGSADADIAPRYDIAGTRRPAVRADLGAWQSQ